MATVQVTESQWRVVFDNEDLQNESLVIDVCDLGFPLGQFSNPDPDVIDPNFSDTFPSLGRVELTLENDAENFDDEFQEREINHASAFDVIETFDFSPSALDLNGNGYVSTGDISAVYSQLLGTQITLGNEELGQFDANGDGSINIQDLLIALQYAGFEVPTGADPVPESYPMYLDEHPDDVAFACSLRKLRSDYDGPCMRVKLDYDKRGLNNFQASGFNWGQYPRENPSPMWNPQSLGVEYVFNFDFRDVYLELEADYPFLTEPVDIGFTEDGYFDYEKILLLMEDPLAVFQPGLSPEEEADFNERYNSPTISPLVPTTAPARSLQGSCVVTIQEWCDQSVNDNGFKSREPGYEPMHPFRTSGLLIAWNDYENTFNIPIKKIVSYGNIPCVGVGSTIGLGDRPWEQFGDDPVVDFQTLRYDQWKGWRCYAYPQEQYGNLSGNDWISGWEGRAQFGYISDNPYGGVYDSGMMYLKQDFNPFFEPDASQYVFNANGDPSYTKGKRTIFRSGFETSQGKGFGHLRGSAVRGSFQGSHSMMRESYLDQLNDSGTGTETQPYSSNWGNFEIDGLAVNAWAQENFRSEDFRNDPVSSFACNMEFNQVSYHSFLSGWGFYADYYRTPNTDVPATVTFTASNNSQGLLLGVRQLFSGIPNPTGIANSMEFIAWNDNLGEESVDNYVRESREYFGRKTLSDDISYTS